MSPLPTLTPVPTANPASGFRTCGKAASDTRCSVNDSSLSGLSAGGRLRAVDCSAILEWVVEAHGGVVDQYIGDCIVAVWDCPDASEGARQAGRTACAIRAAIHAFNRRATPPSALDVHIGIGSGPVIAGMRGGERSGAFTVFGEPVALAQAIGERSAKGCAPGGC